MPKTLATLAAALLLTLSGHALAQAVKVEDGWVRATVPGQQGTGAFMTLTAPRNMRLTGVNSPAAGVAEVHEMTMQGDVMRMRAIDGLDLPAGQPVALKPGGHHVMLMQLKAPLPPGSTVPLTLLLRDAQGAQTRQEVQLPVYAAVPHSAH